jgi:quinol-cytochrome oxidoreductase complex cytochrome b subunit
LSTVQVRSIIPNYGKLAQLVEYFVYTEIVSGSSPLFPIVAMSAITNRWNSNSYAAFANTQIISYPTPINLNYNWSYGSVAGICLVIQILTGIFLSIHYTAHVDYAFSSIEHIIRNIKGGWFLRYTHANGASFFFIVVFAHIFRSIYHGSYAAPRTTLWFSGIIIFLIIIATAFLGYVLPWGQISFWGATVITSIFSAIPVIGDHIVTWLWGGYTVTNVTLNRFYSFHYVLPFIIIAFVLIHLTLLHENGSNNPLGVKTTYINFYPYFYVKDLLSFFILIFIICIFVCFWSNFLGDPTNYIPANPIKTPAHLLPEWYFLPFYAILRVIPHKLLGVLAIFGSLLAIFILPLLYKTRIRSATFRPLYRIWFWSLLGTCLLLGWSGQTTIVGTEGDFYIGIGRILTAYFFFLMLVAPTLFTKLDKIFLSRKISVATNLNT